MTTDAHPRLVADGDVDGCAKIRRAAGEAGASLRPDRERLRAITEMGLAAVARAQGALDPSERIRICAGLPPLAKASRLGDVDAHLDAVKRLVDDARLRAPPPLPRLSRATPPRSRTPTPPAPARHVGHLAFWEFREDAARAIREGRIPPTPERLVEHGHQHHGVDLAEAAEWTERFLSGIQRDLDRRGPRAARSGR